MDISKGYDRFLVFSMSFFELTATQKTFTLEATVRLRAVTMQHHRVGHKIINMLETLEVQGDEITDENNSSLANKYLFAVTYRNVSVILRKDI